MIVFLSPIAALYPICSHMKYPILYYIPYYIINILSYYYIASLQVWRSSKRGSLSSNRRSLSSKWKDQVLPRSLIWRALLYHMFVGCISHIISHITLSISYYYIACLYHMFVGCRYVSHFRILEIPLNSSNVVLRQALGLFARIRVVRQGPQRDRPGRQPREDWLNTKKKSQHHPWSDILLHLPLVDISIY